MEVQFNAAVKATALKFMAADIVTAAAGAITGINWSSR